MAKLSFVAVGMGFACLVAATGAVSAKSEPRPRPAVVKALEDCRVITDSAARLACFDRATDNLSQALGSGQISVVDRSELRQARRSLFGFNMPRLPFFGGDDSAGEAADELETTITATRDIGNGRYRVVIADAGAVWETTETYLSLDPPRAGQKVVIRRGPLGSYMLRFAGQRGVKGKRVG